MVNLLSNAQMIAVKEFPENENNIRVHVIRYNTAIQIKAQLKYKYKVNTDEELLKVYPPSKKWDDIKTTADKKLDELGFVEWSLDEFNQYLKDMAEEKKKREQRGGNLIFRSLELPR